MRTVRRSPPKPFVIQLWREKHRLPVRDSRYNRPLGATRKAACPDGVERCSGRGTFHSPLQGFPLIHNTARSTPVTH